MVENCETNIKLEEKNEWQAWKTKEIEETVGKMRKLQEGNSGKTEGAQEKVWKKHEMEARQSFEKLGT